MLDPQLKIEKANPRLSRIAETFFQVERPLTFRVLAALCFGLFGLCTIRVVHELTGNYFSSITVMTAILVTVFSGFVSGIVIALGIALIVDYLFIASSTIGVVLATREAIEHFLIITLIAIPMSALVATLRKTIRKTISAKREAERASALMEKVLSTISHDIRNSLGVSVLAVDSMQRFSDNPERLRSLIATALEGLNRTDKMIQALLDASRIRGGRPISIKFEYCDLGDVVQETYEALSFVYSEQFRFVRPEPILGFWSSEGIRRAVENLGINAVKYGFRERPITIALSRDADTAILSVHNEGKEIEEGERAKLFDRYFRAESAQRENTKGWGLGLAVVKEVAEAHGGIVTVESNKEDGTTFTITAPIRIDTSAEEVPA